MATDKALAPNIDNSDLVNFPNGRIKDNDGTGNGTAVNRLIYSDLHEFFAKLMRLAGLQYNALPESEGNGYQLVQALQNFAAKNNYLQTLNVTSVIISGIATNVLQLPNIKLSTLNTSEFLICQAGADYNNAITLISGSEPGLYKSISVPASYKANDFIRITVGTPITLERLVDAVNIDEVVGENGYLKATTEADELAGTTNTEATTPYTNQLAFTYRVIGAGSSPFLATDSSNGLMSATDKTKLDSLTAVKNIGWVSGVDPGGGTVGAPLAVSGDVTAASIQTLYGSYYSVSGLAVGAGTNILVTLKNEMDDVNYFVRSHIESLGAVNIDSTALNVVFKIISATQFQFVIREGVTNTQSLKIHFEVVQL